MSSNPARRMQREARRALDTHSRGEPGMQRTKGIHLLPQLAAQAAVPQQQGPIFNVGPLMNDVMLIAWVAAQCPGPAKDAVGRAHDIVVEAQRRHPEFVERMNTLVAAESKTASEGTVDT